MLYAYVLICRAQLRQQQEHVYETTEQIQTYANDTAIHDYVTPTPENRIQDPESEHTYVTPMSENRI